MLQPLSSAANVVMLICFFLMLIRLFREKGALHGILGLICGLYTFIWGWMNVKRHNSIGVMLIWTVAFGVSFVATIIIFLQASGHLQN